ncbi:hypothetical protein M405DRAFT_642555 [Rhizopogon salebrosus TDB-379]|nr:hypothetical protein M405DRAFT_642555 [Rhizopogon salebrosus TDB-379]
MEELFLQPLRSLRFRLRQCPSVVFVVDALHECTSRAEIADLIFLLGQALREPDLPVTHILLTSVSEPHIHNVFQNKEVHPLVCEIPARISAEGIAIIVSLDGADADNDTHVFSEHSSKEPITSSQQLRFEGTSQFPSHSLQRASSFQEFERSYSPQLLHPSSHSSDSDQRRRVDSAGDERRPIVVGAPDHRLDSYHQPRANSADDEERPAVIRVAPEHRLHPYHRPRLNSADDEETPTIMVVPPEHQQSDHRPRVNSTVDEGRPIVDSVVPEHRIHSYQRLRANSAGDEQRSIVVLPPQQVQPPQNVVQHNGDVHFQYSTCTGRKKALCVGINYKGQRRELQGCINDVHNMKRFLTSHWGYREGDVVTLIDDTNNPRQMPTRRNILDAMRWLVKDAHPRDALFFHYSGHQGQFPGENEDEIDELIYPVDYKKAGIINDNDMYRIMVKSLPVGCRLTAIFDSFHLGTALSTLLTMTSCQKLPEHLQLPDLPYIYLSNGRPAHKRINHLTRAQNATGADVISLAACRAGQTSADYGMAIGTISCAFIMSLTRNTKQSYKELLKSVGDILREQYQQELQLSSSHTQAIDTKLRFIL